VRVWVLGSGEQGRRLGIARRFRKEGIAAIGPSKPWEEVKSDGESHRATAIRRFKEEVEIEDAVILRSGMREILDLGILGEYGHQTNRGITGWDLGHVRRVHWLEVKEDELRDLESLRENANKNFGWDSFLPLNGAFGDLEEKVKHLVRGRDFDQSLKTPPQEPESIEFEDLKYGVNSQVQEKSDLDLDDLEEILNEAKGFGQEENGYGRLEADTIAMVLVPLIQALGCDYKNIRVEVPLKVLAGDEAGGKRVDLVILEGGDTSKPRLLIEAKKRWSGLDWAAAQLDDYVASVERKVEGPVPSIVTDGAEFEVRNLPDLDPGLEEEDDPDPVYFSLRWPDQVAVDALTALANYFHDLQKK
jgi:hypothetical protein